MNEIKYDMCDMQYVMCYMQYFMCCVQYDMYDDACYSHGMTFLIRFGKSTDLTFITHIIRRELCLVMYVLGVYFHVPILSTRVY